MKRFKDNYITIFLILMVMAVNIGAFVSYLSNVKSSLLVQTETHVDNIVDEAAECINLKLDEQMNSMEMMSQFITTLSGHENETEIVDELLEKYKESMGYSFLEVVYENDEDYADEEYYVSAFEGKTVLVEEMSDESVTGIVMASPVYNSDGDITAALIAKMDITVFYNITDIASLEQSGKIFVVQKDGTLISKSESLADVSKINDLLPDKKYAESLINGMRSRSSGMISCESDGISRYIGYSKLSINKWYVVSIVSSDTVEASISDMETDVIILGVELGFILAVLISYLVVTIVNRRNREKMNLERYFIAARYSDTITIDYSIVKDTMYCNEKWEKLFGYQLPKSNVKESVKECIYDEDREIIINNYKELTENNVERQFSARVKDKEGNPVKCSFKIFPICAKKGKVVKVIGLIDVED